MNSPTKIVHKAVSTAQDMNIKGTLSDAAFGSDSGIIMGVIIATIRFIIQLRPVATLIALSYIVSAIYNHKIGP